MSASDDAATYCREIEAYLCRKNDGHLIRIVGPAFERVCGWAARGVPLKVACRGIDRCVERYYAKGPRRRPVRVEFCEADVLDVFDEWRRALGLTAVAVGEGMDPGARGAAGANGGEDAGREGGGHGGREDTDREWSGSEQGGEEQGAAEGRSRSSLPAHLDRVLARLGTLRAGTDRALADLVEEMTQELAVERGRSRGLRGEARQALVARLHAMDRVLGDAARASLDPSALGEIAAEAEAELAPFRRRLATDAYERSKQAAVDRLVRERLRLPVVAYDAI